VATFALCRPHSLVVNAKAWARSPFRPDTLRRSPPCGGNCGRSATTCASICRARFVRPCIGRLAGAARMIGEDQPREWAARWLFGERVRTHGVHVIEQAVEVCAAAAGEPLSPILPSLPVNREAEKWADEVLAERNKTAGSSAKPGAGWGAKRWPAERYGAVAKDLQAMWLQGSGQCRTR
jgi:heptosyltransferase-1